MRVERQRRAGAEADLLGRLEHEQLLRRVREVILAAHDVRDPRIEVIDRDGEVVEHRAVRARDHRLVHVHVLKARLTADHVVHDRRAVVRHAQAHGAARLRLATEAALGAVELLERLDVLGRRVRAVREIGVEQSLQRFAMSLAAIGLHDRPLVPVELQPAQRVEDLLDVLRRRALTIGVLDPQHQLAAGVSREQPVEQRRARAADVQRAGRRWCEANPHNPLAC